MGKPRIKLKPARAASPAAKAQQSRDMDRALCLLAEAVGMTPAEVLRNPYAARDKRRALEAKSKALEELKKEALEELKKEHVEKAIAEEHERVMSIYHACNVTGQQQLLMKMVANGTSAAEASSYIYDVAAAESDGLAIHNSHSPEGGHRQAIDYTKIYGRQNARKGAPT